ncbi:hypothetical protein JGH11_15225 [Dysgonomonas sp. Marseille-P4677]|uniref:hypothetical protein n=1 Tax=Dysgonomonas sp. Marseille-P4677 TaxID=2364790 RepID=UPI0019122C15|nr:hypothetical protein [Dysgonomonas sp. Marseille-P4677]MBK5722226.1 hypothetical protein [Dysgonomonas sp. Marseille-P4677]
MKKNEKKHFAEELISLNEDFYTEFSIHELETRLETDPLLFVDFFQESIMSADDYNCSVAGALNVCTPNANLNVCTVAEALNKP